MCRPDPPVDFCSPSLSQEVQIDPVEESYVQWSSFRELEDQLDEAQSREEDLLKQLHYRRREVDLWQNHAISQGKQRHDALLHEERAQGTMIGAEKCLRDLEAHHRESMLWAKQMRDGYALDIADLKSHIQAEKEKSRKEIDHGSRLVGRVEVFLQQLEDTYQCDM